jgi:hypothetical protein
MALSPQQAIRLRLLDDFEFYCPRALKIRTKKAETIPFTWNEAQRRLSAVVEAQYAATGRVRIIILKARQMGLSTWVGGRLFSRVSQRRSKKALVITHHAKSTAALFDMTKRFYKLVPEILKPSTAYNSAKELTFDGLDSSYMIATAGSDTIGRGETITHAHLSELGIWPKSTAKANFSGLMDSVPNEDDTEVYIESTAQGVSGLFYDQWQEALAGRSGYIPVFLPWYIEEGYREKPSEGFQRSPEEHRLVDLYGLDDAQLMFRRLKVSEKGADLFRQEYPSTAEEAFLTTGRPVFHPERLQDLTDAAKAEFKAAPVLSGDSRTAIAWLPQERMALEGSAWREHPRGELMIYRPHDHEETYFVGADVALGVGQDYSVAQVLDSRRTQVAMWSGQVNPDFFGTILYHLGRLYNDAKIICERNNHGVLTNHVLTKTHQYPNFYTEISTDKISEIETEHIGFLTTEKTKPLVIDKLLAEVRERTIEIFDPVTLSEMRSFVVGETGKMAAEVGCHDDTVIALALANHINEGSFTPIINQDSWYVQMG